MILVTGGTGFLGRHLIPRLCQQGHQVRVLTRRAASHVWLKAYPNVETFEGDLRDAGLAAAAVKGCRYVIHAGALFSMWEGAGDFIATNSQGTQHLMQAALAEGCERVVHISTVALVGQPEPGRLIDEQHPAHPADTYQQSKYLAEEVALAHCAQGLPVIVLRPGAFYGPLGDYGFNRLFFRDPMRGIIMQMDGGHYIIFPVYIGDVAETIISALDQGRPGEIYNVCGECLSHRAAFDIICKEAGLRWPRLNIPGFIGLNFARLLTGLARLTQREPFWPVGLRSYVFNNWHVSSAKAHQELGFVPTPFLEGARRTIAWYRAGKPETLPELHCDARSADSSAAGPLRH